MKRAMNPFEKFHTERMCNAGCWICARYAEWNHWMHGMGGGRITIEHLFGCPLCPEHHRTAKDSVHMMGSEEKFCKHHGIDKQRSIDEVAVSLALWVSGRSRWRVV